MSRFFDTNILVYAFLELEKRRRALEVLAEGGIISAQVLNEFTHVARKKRQRPWPDIEAAIAVIRMQFPVVLPITAETHAAALGIARDHNLSFYDALIVASALEAGCDTLYSEDLQDGRAFAGLRGHEGPYVDREARALPTTAIGSRAGLARKQCQVALISEIWAASDTSVLLVAGGWLRAHREGKGLAHSA